MRAGSAVTGWLGGRSSVPVTIKLTVPHVSTRLVLFLSTTGMQQNNNVSFRVLNSALLLNLGSGEVDLITRCRLQESMEKTISNKVGSVHSGTTVHAGVFLCR